MNSFPWFRKFLTNNMRVRYDDDLQIFLMTCLRKIDYFQQSKVSETELTHIARHMLAQQADKDELLLDSKNVSMDMKEQMLIIYEGTLCISMKLEADQELVFDYVSKGTVINAHNYLSKRDPEVDIKCLTSVTYFYLSIQKL